MLAAAAQDAFLQNRSEPAHRRKTPVPRGLLELGEGLQAQLLVEQPRPLRPHALDPHHLDESLRDLPRELVEQRKTAGPNDLGDLAGEVLADARQLRETVAVPADELGDRLAQRLDRAGGRPVGADPEGILVLNFEQVGDLLETLRDVDVVHARSFQDARARARKRFSVSTGTLRPRALSSFEPGSLPETR
jgi:hypothetical protein